MNLNDVEEFVYREVSQEELDFAIFTELFVHPLVRPMSHLLFNLLIGKIYAGELLISPTMQNLIRTIKQMRKHTNGQ